MILKKGKILCAKKIINATYTSDKFNFKCFKNFKYFQNGKQVKILVFINRTKNLSKTQMELSWLIKTNLSQES